MEAGDPHDDHAHEPNSGEGGRPVEEDDPERRRPDRPDSRPDRVRRPDREVLDRLREKEHAGDYGPERRSELRELLRTFEVDRPRGLERSGEDQEGPRYVV